MKPTRFFIRDADGFRLCKDNLFRSFAMFGTERCCVKFYKHEGRALNVAKKLGLLENSVVGLCPEDSMDASGRIERAKK